MNARAGESGFSLLTNFAETLLAVMLAGLATMLAWPPIALAGLERTMLPAARIVSPEPAAPSL